MRATTNNGISAKMAQIERDLAKAVTAGMGDVTADLKTALRNQVREAGLGDRLANTWRGETYPSRKASLHPTSFAWSKAPEIIGFYAGGGAIVPIGGHPYLAIPTRAVPRSSKRGRARLDVAAVMQKLGAKLIIIKGKKGHLLGLYDANRTRAGNQRRGTKGRELVLLFTFVPQVRGQKRFDVPALVKQIAGEVPAKIKARL